MRIGPFVILAFTAFSSGASASDVRLLSFPDSVRGTWGPSTDACKGSAPGKIDIAEKTHSTADASCAVSWVTVTASRDGPVYSARSMCTETKTGSDAVERATGFDLFRAKYPS